MFQKGRYYDGKNAKAYNVQVQVSDSVVGLKDIETGRIIARWFYDDIRLLEHPIAQAAGKLGTHDNPDERLLLEAGPDWDEIVANIPKTSMFAHKLSLNWSSLAFYSILSVVIGGLLFWKGPDVFEQTAYLVPASMEQKLGDYVLKSSGYIDETCNNPKGAAAFEALIAPIMNRDNYNVHVSNDPMVNAFAMPGSHIVIFDGLIQSAQSPEEIAAIIGHEMGHVDKRHPMRGLMRQMGLSIALQMMVGDISGLSNLGEIAGTLRAMDYSREQEFEADLYAIEVMKRADYNPYAIVDFFYRISEEEEEAEKYMKYLKFLSTHPETEERIQIIENLKSQDSKTYKPALSASQWNDLQGICGTKEDA